MDKQDLKDLIANNKTNEAILELLKMTKDSEYESDVILQSRAYKQYERDSIRGNKANEDLTILLNQINHRLLSIISHFDEPIKKKP